MTQTSPTTLSAALWPVSESIEWRAARAVLLAIVGSAFIAICAKINVPMIPVPMTMQTFAVVVVGAAFGWKLGGATVLLYLLEGISGMPVFAGPTAGPLYMAGPTAGYLVGFFFAAVVVGWLAERGWGRNPGLLFAAMTLGTAVIFALGFAWLATLIGADKAFAAGVWPFLIGAAVKCALGAAVVSGGWAILRRKR